MEIRVLGPVQVLAEARTVPVGGPKERALLARLALSANQVVSVSQLLDDLWGDARPADPASALQVHVSRVRRALRSVPEAPIITGDGGGYRLVIETEMLDAARFEASCVRARRAVEAGEHRDAATRWRGALGLWQGPALADVLAVPFAALEAARLEEGRLVALEGRIAADLACGQAAAVAGELELLTRTHPLREGLWALRMLALYRCGRQAEALATYQEVRAALADSLGLDPGPALRELESAMLRQDPELDHTGYAPATDDAWPASILATEGRASAPSDGRTAYVGRDAELAELRRLLEQIAGGIGALVLIGGEPGVGKTRLATEISVEAARLGIRSWIGHCYEAVGAPPFVALVEMLESAMTEAPSPAAWRRFLGDDAPEVAKLLPTLRRHCPDVPPALELPAEQGRRLLFNSLCDVIARTAKHGPIVLALDDLQWADEPTLRFLEHLAERLAGMPVLVVGTYRDTEVEVGTAAARTFEDLRRRRAARWMSLARLSDAEVGAMLGALSGQHVPPQIIRAVHAGTDGNPFFVEEVYRHLVEQGRLLDADGHFRSDLTISEIDVPDGVRLVTGRRLARLDPSTVPLLTVAAVAGRTFSVELLELLVADPERVLDALEDALRARLITALHDPSGEDRFLFAHELIRQTLLTDLTLTRRRRLHEHVADALEQHHADRLDAHAAAIAQHLLDAGAHRGELSQRVFDHLVRAGRFAAASAAFEDALAHFLRAAELGVGTDRQRAALAAELGNAYVNVGHLDPAVECWRRSLDAYEALADADAIGTVCVNACYHLVFLGRWEDGLAIGMRGLEAIADRAAAARSRLLGTTAFPLAYIGGHQQASAMVDEALEIAEMLDDAVLQAHGLFARVMVGTAHLQLAEVIAAGETAAALFAAAGDPWNELHVAGFMAYAYTCAGRFAECHRWATRYIDAAERYGNYTAGVQLNRMRGLIEFGASGDLDRLEELGRSDRSYIEASEMPWASGWSWLGLASFLRGRQDDALPFFREAARREPLGALRGWNAAVAVEALAYAGAEAEALTLLEQVGLPAQTDPESWTWGRACMALAATEAFVVLGRLERAAALYPVLLALHGRTGLVSTGYDDCRLYERAAGIAATCAGQYEAAEAHFSRALDQAAALPHRLEAAHAQRWFAWMLRRRGAPQDRAAADGLLAAAGRAYAEMRMPGLRQMCSDPGREPSG